MSVISDKGKQLAWEYHFRIRIFPTGEHPWLFDKQQNEFNFMIILLLAKDCPKFICCSYTLRNLMEKVDSSLQLAWFT